ncbi:MAG: DUF2789 domain-containing protein [Pseudomonadota bacterium]|nr:DUF2789 domain-containing protein [Pseudomonadota bacterium]
MDSPVHDMCNLFAQLGLPSDKGSVMEFIRLHQSLRKDVLLYEAPFWTKSQAEFLQEELLEDADWAKVIDELNVALHMEE